MNAFAGYVVLQHEVAQSMVDVIVWAGGIAGTAGSRVEAQPVSNTASACAPAFAAGPTSRTPADADAAEVVVETASLEANAQVEVRWEVLGLLVALVKKLWQVPVRAR